MELPVSLPDLASLLAKLGATEHDPEGSGIAELYLEIFSNSPKTRLLLEASSVPLCFNFEVISALLPEENITSEDMHIFLSSKILKEDNDLTLPYRRLPDLIRRALRKHLAKENYDFFSKISFRAYHFFQADVSYQAEAFYHGLIANPYETVEHISDAYYALEQAKQDLSIRKIGMTLEDLLGFPGLSPIAEACVQLYVGKIKSTKIDLRKRKHLVQNALALFQNLAQPKGEAESWHALGDI